MMDFVKTLADLDQIPELHIARLLILINTFTEDKTIGSIEGLTKLAKLDFLLRYPVLLERALITKGHSIKNLNISENEVDNVESEMVRYRFGPWDHRYRQFLNILIAQNLIKVSIEGRKVVILATEEGTASSNNLCLNSLFKQYSERSRIIKTYFNMSSTNLVNFVYKTFPEIVSLRSNQRIKQ